MFNDSRKKVSEEQRKKFCLVTAQMNWWILYKSNLYGLLKALCPNDNVEGRATYRYNQLPYDWERLRYFNWSVMQVVEIIVKQGRMKTLL